MCGRLLRAHAKHQEAVFGDLPYQGCLVTLPMDVTREDVLHEAMDVIRRNLPAGHDGNEATTCCIFPNMLFMRNAIDHGYS